MRETLRLSPPAAARGMAPLEDTTLLNGKYSIAKGQNILIHVSQAHRDPAVWGDDAEEFRPERNLDGKFEALPVRWFFCRCRVGSRFKLKCGSLTHGNHSASV